MKKFLPAFIAGLAGLAQAATACTGIMLTGADGSVVRARTMEWGSFDLQSSVSVVPPGHEMSARMSDGSEGASWKAKYGFVGATGLGKLMVSDGINQAGLSGGTFYLPGFAEFQDFDPDQVENSIGPGDVVNFALSNFATVQEVRDALQDIRVVAVAEEALGFVPPVHFTFSDPSGDMVVVEYVNKELHLHDAPLGVITNSPPYDWHMTNLRNYLNLSATELPQRTVGDTNFAPLGAGSGMIGLPGDFTPPSRFVRAVAFTQSARETSGNFDTVREAFRILDNFNVPAHAVADAEAEGDLVLSATQFTSASDMDAKQFYYHTQHDRTLRVIDLEAIDFAALNGVPVTKPMDEDRASGGVEEVTFGQ